MDKDQLKLICNAAIQISDEITHICDLPAGHDGPHQSGDPKQPGFVIWQDPPEWFVGVT